MSPRPLQQRPLKRRQPLGDASNWINARLSTPSSDDACSPVSLKIPHHESLTPGGNLPIPINPPSSSPPPPPSSPLPPLPPSSSPVVEDNRLSAITNESQRNSNRDSQISTVSTNASGKSRRKTHVGPWRLGKTLGQGASGRVRKARHAITGQDAAVKIVSKQVANYLRTDSLANMDTIINSGPGQRRKIPFGIEREVVIMKLIEHPHIISLYDVWENRGEL